MIRYACKTVVNSLLFLISVLKGRIRTEVDRHERELKQNKMPCARAANNAIFGFFSASGIAVVVGVVANVQTARSIMRRQSFEVVYDDLDALNG